MEAVWVLIRLRNKGGTSRCRLFYCLFGENLIDFGGVSSTVAKSKLRLRPYEYIWGRCARNTRKCNHFLVSSLAAIAQLVRALACHARGWRFEPAWPRRLFREENVNTKNATATEPWYYFRMSKRTTEAIVSIVGLCVVIALIIWVRHAAIERNVSFQQAASPSVTPASTAPHIESVSVIYNTLDDANIVLKGTHFSPEQHVFMGVSANAAANVFNTNVSSNGTQITINSVRFNRATSTSIPIRVLANEGDYTVRAPTAADSNEVSILIPEVITSPAKSLDANIYKDADFGFAIDYLNRVTISKAGNIVTLSDGDPSSGNSVTIKEVTGTSVTDSSGKFGNVTYSSANGQWLVSRSNEDGTMSAPVAATPTAGTKSDNPIFTGVIPVWGWGRFDYIVPISPTKFLVIDGPDNELTQRIALSVNTK
jgi:hypothetical protein